MTQVAEQMKIVKCLGIACPTGFNLNPAGAPPSFVMFEPGVASALPAIYADWLVAQDSSRFVVEEPVKQEAAPEPEQPKKKKK